MKNSSTFKGKFSDNKGEYSLFEVEYIDDPCNCHPETCCCWRYNWTEHEKRYLNGIIVKINNHSDNWIKKR